MIHAMLPGYEVSVSGCSVHKLVDPFRPSNEARMTYIVVNVQVVDNDAIDD